MFLPLGEGTGALGIWRYPLTKDVLEECGLHPVKAYINTRRSTIAMYVVNRQILRECQEEKRMRGQCLASGGVSRSSAWAHNCPFVYNE
jgi:hypothetical protein